ncbi:hypothetical protein KA012_02970 [Candidatus Woesebacteria bacterium]|nr:hypothetical protein [Candidatus Woesebacteria bacterium]
MKTSQQVFENAQSLLANTEIIKLFTNLGEVHIIGSCAANLMWDPDIDVIVLTDDPQKSALKAMNDLAKKEKFQKLEFGDFKNHPMKDGPKSFVVNARKEWMGEEWEIETWFVRELGEALDVLEKLKNFSDSDRAAIIEKKKQRSLSGRSKHDLSSWEIYQDYM